MTLTGDNVRHGGEGFGISVVSGGESLIGPPVTRAQVGLVAGPILFALMLMLSPPEGMAILAWRTAAVGVLMATWWIAEAVPIAATALLPIVLFPALEIATVAATTAPYANPVIYLFLGGFLIAMALEGCGLHRRLAMSVIGVFGTRPANLVFGFMAATAFISMWVSNSATVVMMLPMATAIIALRPAGADATDNRQGGAFEVALLLGIAYAANIGGLGTLIGTPPNALLAGFMSETYGVQIGFVEWMTLGVPIVLIALPCTWFVLTRWLYPVGVDPIAGGAALVRRERLKLGSLSKDEWIVGTITAFTATAWVSRPIVERWIPRLE
jgi:sodium-dependent dicarboxylate transporter 2/3/5